MFDSRNLADRGFTVGRALIGPEECRGLAALWPDPIRFRKHIVMQRLGYGQGEYQYFTYPLPPAIERLQASPIKELVVTNSIHVPESKRVPKVTVLSVAALLGETILRISSAESVSSLFVD